MEPEHGDKVKTRWPTPETTQQMQEAVNTLQQCEENTNAPSLAHMGLPQKHKEEYFY